MVIYLYLRFGIDISDYFSQRNTWKSTCTSKKPGKQNLIGVTMEGEWSVD